MSEEREPSESPQTVTPETGTPEAENAEKTAAEPSAPEDGTEDAPGLLSRRGFVLGAMTVIGGIAAAIIAIPTAAFMSAPGWLSEIPRRLLSETVSPALRSDEWSSAGPIEDLRLGEPKYMLIERDVVDGFVTRKAEVGVWVVRSGEAEANVFDPHCTHLGCPVSWASGSASFLSPCHGGVFDVEGFPTAGPPPRRLDIYETRIDSGEIMVGKLLDSV